MKGSRVQLRAFLSAAVLAAAIAWSNSQSSALGRPGLTPVPCPDQTWQVGDATFDALPGAKAFFGKYDGGLYRIEIPENWNGELALYAHGFVPSGGAQGSLLRVGNVPMREHLVKQGFAWAASSYRCNGYVPGQGLLDTMALPDLFTKVNNERAPQRVYLTGTSMGGHVTLLGMHEFPASFAGGLAMCPAGPELFDFFGAVSAAAEVVTGVQFNSATLQQDIAKMAEIVGTPPNYTDKGRQLASIQIQISGGPRPFAIEGLTPRFLANIGTSPAALVGSTTPTNRALTNTHITYAIDEGLGLTAEAINARVRRKAADPAMRNPDGPYEEVVPFDGKIERPLLTMHGTGDLFVPVFLQQVLKRAVVAAGNERLLVQRLYRIGAHCQFSQAEMIDAFDDLVKWVRQGTKPEGDEVSGDLRGAGLKFTEPRRANDPGGLTVKPAATGGQGPQAAHVDFARDVQPIFKQNCVGCHGAAIHQNGLRLDQRSAAMRGSTTSPGVIRPGSSETSLLYIRVSGSQFGPQMPPTGPLRPEQTAIIKAWIDQGAEWPDELAGETPAAPPDPRALQLVEALRAGNRESFKTLAAATPNIGGLRGPGGTTPLMAAVLYGDAAALRTLLDGGADPNASNDAGATALMWAVNDVEKTRLLLDRGAKVDVRSDDGRTPLLMASGLHGSAAVVKLLLDRGANPSVKAPGFGGDTFPLTEAAAIGNAAVVRMLVERGADVKAAGFVALALALNARCTECFDLLVGSLDQQAVNIASLVAAPPLGDAVGLTRILDRSADAAFKDSDGRTLLMRTASSDALPLDSIKTLIARGADVNAKSPKGETALGFAKLHGATAAVDLLLKAGAREDAAPMASPITYAPAVSPRAAVERIMPLLQESDAATLKKSGCVSCHHNTLTAMAVAIARSKGVRVDEQIAHDQVQAIGRYIDSWRERALQGIGIPGDSDTVSSILLGLSAENYPADEGTEAMARFLRRQQRPSGQWRIFAHRPPLESSDIQVTAASMHALQIYAPKTDRAAFEKSVQLAAAWLTSAQPRGTEDRAFQLLGLGWAKAKPSAIQKAAQAFLAQQRPDGGWSQLPSLMSDAYATGQALVALEQSGAIAATDPAYTRGVQYLLNTQLEDGSWYVKTRALPIQLHFESGFPHGKDQFISAAASNWAAMALALAVRPGS